MLLSLVASALLHPAAAGALSFTPGHYYTTNYFWGSIVEYGPSGEVIETTTLPSEVGADLRGLAFGPDGLLYVTTSRGTGFAVLALDGAGTVRETYLGSIYVGGNISYGKLALDEEYLYVAGQNHLTRFERGDPSSGVSIYTNNQVFDVEVLPDGNLLVASAYQIQEITTAGAVVRSLGPSYPNHFTDIRGVEYDPASDTIFVTHLGHSNFFFRLMRIDGSTGQLEANVVFTYADDLYLTDGGELLVGSRTQSPRLYTTDLELVDELAGGQRMFVTQYPVPELSTLGLVSSGLALLALGNGWRGSRATFRRGATSRR